MIDKKVFVSGCFDMLHSGHIFFLQKASLMGEVYVSIGSDETIFQLKGRKPVCSEKERLYMISSLRFVKEAFISSENGTIDFIRGIESIKPDIFIVNFDGDTTEKRELCNKYGIEYIICDRDQYGYLSSRSSTSLRKHITTPYRIEICGGWLDQPFVSKTTHGSVINISIEPNSEFIDSSGIASSTRQCAIDLWKSNFPEMDLEKTAKTLFAYENFPGKNKDISGSQDSIGIVYPGVHNLYYNGSYWPSEIKTVIDPCVLSFLESHIFLYYLGDKKINYGLVAENMADTDMASSLLSESSNLCWESILSADVQKLGRSITDGGIAKDRIFPGTIPIALKKYVSDKAQIYGYGVTGTGFGGYAVIVSDYKPDECLEIIVRR